MQCRKGVPVTLPSVYKLHVPLVYTMLPEFLQNRVSPYGTVSYLLAPSWKERELILCGSYLYRFLKMTSNSPKGAPVSLQGVQAKIIEEGDDDLDNIGLDAIIANLPPGIKTVFAVNSFGKQRYFATASREDALTWVNSIRQARQEAITRSMGHSKVPTPQSWDYFDERAKALIKKKERIKRRANESTVREFDTGGMGSALRPIY